MVYKAEKVMRKAGFGLLATIIVLAANAALWAQRPDSHPAREGSVSRGTVRSSTWSAPRASSSSRTTSVAAATSNPSSRVFTRGPSAAATDVGRQISSSLRDRYGSWPGYSYSPTNLLYCSLFYRRLLLDYGYLPRYDYLGVYAQGVPPLSMDAVGLALRKSSSASERIVRLSSDLRLLLDDYEAGRLEEREFEELFSEKIGLIRRLARDVRQDFYVAYLDQGKDSKPGSFEKAHTVAELRALLDELDQWAVDLRGGIQDFYDQDQTRVISVDSLSQPSLETLSRGISKLAKTIGQSARRL